MIVCKSTPLGIVPSLQKYTTLDLKPNISENSRLQYVYSICMCIYIYIYIYVCYLFMFVYIYVHICICTHINKYIHTLAKHSTQNPHSDYVLRPLHYVVALQLRDFHRRPELFIESQGTLYGFRFRLTA